MSIYENKVNQQFDHFYSTYLHWLQGWLRSRLACSQQAADFAQDTFVRILSSSNVYDQLINIREPRSYLATIANRVMIDHFRRSALEKAYLETLMQQPEDVDISPEQRVLMLESLYELDAMLTGLGKNIRRAFLLSQLQGVNYADIAIDLGVSVSSVKKYIAKATASCLLYALEADL
ncbi:MAG: sigma-70 family RNA polymerase sigma factor [Spongiibacteraceae bacterium]